MELIDLKRQGISTATDTEKRTLLFTVVIVVDAELPQFEEVCHLAYKTFFCSTISNHSHVLFR